MAPCSLDQEQKLAWINIQAFNLRFETVAMIDNNWVQQLYAKRMYNLITAGASFDQTPDLHRGGCSLFANNLDKF